MNPDDDLEGEEFDGLQSYARKGMAQELAKKLGLLGDVPGAETDQQDQQQDEQPPTDDTAQLDPEMLQKILASLKGA